MSLKVLAILFFSLFFVSQMPLREIRKALAKSQLAKENGDNSADDDAPLDDDSDNDCDDVNMIKAKKEVLLSFDSLHGIATRQPRTLSLRATLLYHLACALPFRFLERMPSPPPDSLCC